jgi:murein DD-endopeptidase MepM/ murein hydrolase activator NlpD
MNRHARVRTVALCALIALPAALTASVARAQPAGAYLVHSVTESSPANGGRVVVDTIDPFQASGGLAIFEPGSAASETFTYSGVDESTSELTGVVRTRPAFHPGGSFVQAILNASPSPTPKPSHSPSPKPHPSGHPSPQPSPSPGRHKRKGSRHERPIHGRGDRHDGGFERGDDVGLHTRHFGSKHLVAVATQLRALGWSKRRVTRTVFRPFPVGALTTFTNTWGALRYGPRPGQVRGHEGQDLFCNFGAPLLAVQRGRILFDTNGLGGRIARLHVRGGSYWYYAHLSRWNSAEFHSGDRVKPGDVVGYCGHSGDALTTPNHLHFGWYTKDGKAHNPMKVLLEWLHTANRRAGRILSVAKRREARTMEVQTLARMFGDSWAPDLSEAPS